MITFRPTVEVKFEAETFCLVVNLSKQLKFSKLDNAITSSKKYKNFK